MRLFEDHALPVLTAGVDEVGRGPLAGPVMAAAVILDPGRPIRGLKDSKVLSAAQRQGLAEQIREWALCWALGRAEVAEIDAINILRASHLAMQRAVQALSVSPELIFVDGHLLPAFAAPAVALVGGDALMPAISAAGIIAKVARDAEMARWAQCYPGYGLERHKGYATAAHLQALAALGPTPLHRQSFAPVRALLVNRELF